MVRIRTSQPHHQSNAQGNYSYHKIHLCQRIIKGFQAVALMAIGQCSSGREMWRRAVMKGRLRNYPQLLRSSSLKLIRYNKNDFSNFVRKDNPDCADDFCRDITYWGTDEVKQAQEVICALQDILTFMKASKKPMENRYFIVPRKTYYELRFKAFDHGDDPSATLFEDQSESLISREIYLSMIRGYILVGGQFSFPHLRDITSNAIYLIK
ncbi:MAG: hypothetical protein ACSNEK_01125 [Parachlamydiaceae bacterium]